MAVDGCEVTLTGTLPSWHERKQAALAAWASPHVGAVNNLIEVATG